MEESRESKVASSRNQSLKRKPSDRKPSDRKPPDRKPSDRKPSDRKPSDRKPSDRKPSGGGSTLRREREERKRIRTFAEPDIPSEVTGKELEKRELFQLQSLALENAEAVAQHLACARLFMESDPERAYWHGQSAAFRAGRVALAREMAGRTALLTKRYEVARKELKTAYRIAGSIEVLPYIAESEVALGNARKALEIAGSVDPRKLSTEARVQLRIAASMARISLGESDAAVVTLTCSELNDSSAPWSNRLRRSYRDALLSAKREEEAVIFEARHPESFVDMDQSPLG
jgi:hypothetical protein